MATCKAPGISTAAVALANSLNASLIRRWVLYSAPTHQAVTRAKSPQALSPALPSPPSPSPSPDFVPLDLNTSGADIRIELRKGDQLITLHWPLSAAAQRVAGLAAVIRIDAAWLAVKPMDMRAGPDTTQARVVAVFGAALPHHAYVFANARKRADVLAELDAERLAAAPATESAQPLLLPAPAPSPNAVDIPADPRNFGEYLACLGLLGLLAARQTDLSATWTAKGFRLLGVSDSDVPCRGGSAPHNGNPSGRIGPPPHPG